jgi:Tfp pilus assembly protein FimT
MPTLRARRWPIASAAQGFTLLELLAMTALLALVAAMATVRFSASFRSAQIATTIAILHDLDGQLRTLAAKQKSPYELRINLTQQTLSVSANGNSQQQPVRTYAISSPIKIAAVRSAREERTSGEAVVRCDGSGMCETYAIEITAPSALARWILFTGVTGQPLEKLTDRQIEELFDALRPQRTHTD